MSFKFPRPLISHILIFAVTLLALALFLHFTTPCLSPPVGSSFTFSECELNLITDRYLHISLIILALSAAYLTLIWRPYPLKDLLPSLIICSLVVIIAYYLFLPSVIAASSRTSFIISP